MAAAAVISVVGMSDTAYADIASGTSGTCSWVIDDASTLTIRPTDGVSGTLESSAGSSASYIPWYSKRTSVKKVVIDAKSLKKVGKKAFSGIPENAVIKIKGNAKQKAKAQKLISRSF